jgi:hypothetical protein
MRLVGVGPSGGLCLLMQAVLVAACALLLFYREYTGYLYELLTCTVSMCVASGPSAVLLHGRADGGGARVERGLTYTTRRCGPTLHHTAAAPQVPFQLDLVLFSCAFVGSRRAAFLFEI